MIVDISMILDVIWGLIITYWHMLAAATKLSSPQKLVLLGKTVLVTGAGRGLGRELCFQLAWEGSQLICIDIDEKSVEETARIINTRISSPKERKALHFVVDVTNEQDILQLTKKIDQIGISVDVLINNAGVVTAGSILAQPRETIIRLLDVNLKSHFLMIRAFLPKMLEENNGHIVAVSSAAAFSCAANIAAYTATKYAVTGLMQCLREELRQKKCDIGVTTVHPFFLDSGETNVEHWKVKSRLPSLSIPLVAEKVVDGIKKKNVTVNIPNYMFYAMNLIKFLPTPAQDYWRDTFYANIESIN